MLDLDAFYHLPQLAALFDEIARDNAGMVVVAGMEARAGSLDALGAPPRSNEPPAPSSGRGFIYGILARQVMRAQLSARAAIVSENKEPALRLPPRLRDRVKVYALKPGDTYDDVLQRAASQGFSLLFAEKLTPDCLASALSASRATRRVIAQLDSPLYGAWVARELRDRCGDAALIGALKWVVAVRRLPALCDQCKTQDGNAFRADGCDACSYTGQRGEVALFDVWRAEPGADPLTQPSMLSFQEYAAELVTHGYLKGNAAANLDAEQLYVTWRLLTASEERGVRATQSLRTRVAELESAKRVLEQQYRVSIALQEVGRQLLELDSVQELATYIAHRARDLTGADRAVLYLLHPDGTAEIAALNGWDNQWLGTRVSFEELIQRDDSGDRATAFRGYPPGIPTRRADIEGVYIRAGLHVPLVAQREVVGAMIFHSTMRKAFDPRDAALLQALANAGAAAIQRTGLIDSLRDHIQQLEAAQVEIAKKERLERELELARQVQQTMLPHIFPLMPGIAFYARNEPARQVGGDFYDVFVLDADRVGLVIADVSDKGMPAALFMALTRSLVRAEAQRERSPDTVLRRVHRLLLDTAEATQFVTLFYGVIDLTARTLTYVRARHDYPLLLRGAEVMQLRAPGTILGLLAEDELRLGEETVALEPGDRLVLYTDGLTDALDAQEEQFGRERLIEVARRERSAPLQVMGDALFAAVAAHQGDGEMFDDMTLLLTEIK